MHEPSPAPPVARPPKRLFRLGPLADPLAVPADAPDGAWDDPAAARALHLFATRRGALLDAFSPGDRQPRSLAGTAIVPVRLDDPRPFLDLRDPFALPPDLAALANDDPSARAALVRRADELGLAGVVDALPGAPTQTRWVLLDSGAVRLLAPPAPLSPHDPDLVAVRRLLTIAPDRDHR